MISRLPGLSLPERAWGVVRRWALAWWRILYLGAVVCVLVLSPSSYGKVTRRALARHLYLDTAPVLLGVDLALEAFEHVEHMAKSCGGGLRAGENTPARTPSTAPAVCATTLLTW